MKPKQNLSAFDELDEWLDKLGDVIEMIGSGDMIVTSVLSRHLSFCSLLASESDGEKSPSLSAEQVECNPALCQASLLISTGAALPRANDVVPLHSRSPFLAISKWHENTRCAMLRSSGQASNLQSERSPHRASSYDF